MFFSLIARAKKDPKAFGELYEQHFDAIYKYLYYRVRNGDEAEDLCSQTWEKVLTHLSGLKSDNETVFKAWLYQIARNTLFEFYRRKKVTISIEENELDLPSEENFAKEIASKDEAEKIRILLGGLPSMQQEIVRLHFFAELKNKEIAKLIEEDERVVAVQLSRALKSLEKRCAMLL